MTNKSALQEEMVERCIIEIRQQRVILDSDVAKLYGVETKHVNQAVKNNSDKFPDGYIIALDRDEWLAVKSKILTSPLGGGKVKIPNVFTEKGLYMLATILRSRQATATTIAIIETFSKIRELSKTIKQLSQDQENARKKGLMERSGKLVTALFEDDVFTNEQETTIELNFAVLKLKHTVKKSKKLK